jgi:hypothetical protein
LTAAVSAISMPRDFNQPAPDPEKWVPFSDKIMRKTTMQEI